LKHAWFNILKKGKDEHTISVDVVEKLQVFGKRTNLAKFCMEVIVHTMQPEQIEDLRAEFIKLDTEGIGEITLKDVRIVLKKSMRENDIEKIFAGLDYNHSGTIDYHEFLAATVSRKAITEKNLKAAFERISNHNEYFTTDDMENLLGVDAAPGQVATIFKEANLSADRLIHYRTFKNLLEIEAPSPKKSGKQMFFPSSPASTAANTESPGRSSNRRNVERRRVAEEDIELEVDEVKTPDTEPDQSKDEFVLESILTAVVNIF
jgi:Ca2+-binding EF-hand superfamily protein